MSTQILGANSTRILVTGAVGQIGSELTMALRERYGPQNVVATGHPHPARPRPARFGTVRVPGRHAEREPGTCRRAVPHRHDLPHGRHPLCRRRSQAPALLGRQHQRAATTSSRSRASAICVSFAPARSPPLAPRPHATTRPKRPCSVPEPCTASPRSPESCSADYVAARFGVDVRGVRYPGIISNVTPPGGGTTDYAVEIFYAAIREQRYTCFVRPDTVLPMMYMPDCIQATLDLMDGRRRQARPSRRL